MRATTPSLLADSTVPFLHVLCCACFGAGTLTHLPPLSSPLLPTSAHSSSSPLAHLSTARRQVAASEGRREAPVMDSSYLVGDPPAGPMDFDESQWRGCAVASRGGDEGSYEVRGRELTTVVGHTP